jgi:hypothetical protein
MQNAPTISCLVTFLTEEQGGRSSVLPPGALSRGVYLPHLVVGNPNQREATASYQGQGDEPYLGVAFVGGPEVIEAGSPLPVSLALMYFPQVDYGALSTGATFTVREGPKVVGYGMVIRGIE